MTLFSMLEDEVGPGVVNTPEELTFNNEECSHCKQKKN